MILIQNNIKNEVKTYEDMLEIFSKAIDDYHSKNMSAVSFNYVNENQDKIDKLSNVSKHLSKLGYNVFFDLDHKVFSIKW